jgi:hypothetical protein
MITIFDYINDVMFFKRNTLLSNVDDEAAYNPYLVNRWISMYSSDYAIAINSTVNWMYSIFETKREQYSFLVNVLPQGSRRRIHYIKKNKTPQEKKISADTIKLLAINLELSEREISAYIESGLIDLKSYEKN